MVEYLAEYHPQLFAVEKPVSVPTPFERILAELSEQNQENVRYISERLAAQMETQDISSTFFLDSVIADTVQSSYINFHFDPHDIPPDGSLERARSVFHTLESVVYRVHEEHPDYRIVKRVPPQWAQLPQSREPFLFPGAMHMVHLEGTIPDPTAVSGSRIRFTPLVHTREDITYVPASEYYG